MRSRRTAVLRKGLAGLAAAVTLWLGAAAQSPAFPGDSADARTRLTAMNRGLSEVAAQGDAELTTGREVFRSDAPYPLAVRGRLPVRPGDRLSLVTGAPARLLYVTLLQVYESRMAPVDRRLKAAATDSSRRRWRLLLPRRLRGANVIDVDVHFRSGPADDVDFWVGIRSDCRGRR